MPKNQKYNVIKSILYVATLLILQSCFTSRKTRTNPKHGQTLIVDNQYYSNNDSTKFMGSSITFHPKIYPDIQSAINEAKSGDTILVKEGIYEGNISIKKRIHIIGESPEKVLLLPISSNKSTNNRNIGIDISSEHYGANGTSISSVQIRNFDFGIESVFNKNIYVTNCIISSRTTLRLQGSNIHVKNSTLIGETYATSGTDCYFDHNIFYDNSYESYIHVIEFHRSYSDSLPRFTYNVIYGGIDTRIDTTNIVANPEFVSLNNNNFLSPYTNLGYGAKILGDIKIEVPKDLENPMIKFTNSNFNNDTIFIGKSYLSTKIVVYDKSPIKRIIINSDDIHIPLNHKFSAFKYNYTIERHFNFSEGIHNLKFTSEDFNGNKTVLNKTIVYYIGSKSDWVKKNIAKNKSNIENKYAVVFGVNDYQHPFTPLKYTLNDSREIKLILEKYGYNVDYKENPTRSEIIKMLDDLHKIERENDKIVIYYSGHGSSESSIFTETNGLILPRDIDINNLSATALPIYSLRSFISNLESKNVTILLDMCFAGGGKSFGSMPKNSNQNIVTDQLISGEGKVILASSGDFEISREETKFKHGVFTYYLLEALTQGLITVDEVYNYVYEKSVKWCNQKPRKITINEEIEGVKPLF